MGVTGLVPVVAPLPTLWIKAVDAGIQSQPDYAPFILDDRGENVAARCLQIGGIVAGLLIQTTGRPTTLLARSSHAKDAVKIIWKPMVGVKVMNMPMASPSANRCGGSSAWRMV